jgi:hypothetical protein
MINSFLNLGMMIIILLSLAYLICRHSDASNRPLFSAIFKMLGHLDSDLLSWTEKDKAAHPRVTSLGASLEAGDELYTDLQDYYLDEASKRQ